MSASLQTRTRKNWSQDIPTTSFFIGSKLSFVNFQLYYI